MVKYARPILIDLSFNFHMLDAVTDNHIDSYIIIIRPGLALVRNKKLVSCRSLWENGII